MFTPWIHANIITGDAIEKLRTLPAKSVNCCVTSPPYFGLRDYGHAGQIGLEETPEQYVSKLVTLFREVHRVLRDDGTLWLNLGDSYARAGGWSDNHGLDGVARGESNRAISGMSHNGKSQKLINGLKSKDLIGIPWRVAFALQSDGWYLRQDIIWHKPNPMPESVKDRCTKSHEYMFLMSKSASYYFDADAIKEPTIKGAAGSTFNTGKTAEHGLNRSSDAARIDSEFRNKRDVWTVSTRPYKEAHFATFPPELIKPCVLAGAPEYGVVLDPFGGAGTTGLVALQNKRSAVLIELNPDYVALIQKRLVQV